VNETLQERKSLLAAAMAVLAIALALRTAGDHRIPPFDDLYHLKRIAEFPRILDFDPDRGERGAFCPWPPLYDFLLGSVQKLSGGVTWCAPLFFAAFAASVTFAMRRLGLLAACTAGLTLAVSPYLVGASEAGHIDHHYVEPLLVLLILAATVCRNGIALGIAIAIALLIQPALFVAAGLAFFALFFSQHSREGAKAFAIAAAAVAIYRFTRASGYPDSAWFLGFPHAALLAGAAVACALRERASRFVALAGGVAIALSFRSAATAFFTGLHFFGGDPWLSSIIEFQPMFRHVSEIGTDIANLTGGALLGLLLWRKQRTVAFFSTAYLLLAISSRRFLVPAIALFAISGALAAAYSKRRALAIAAAAITLLPPIAYDVYAMRSPEPSNEEFRVIGERMRALPRGRVLAPWSFGHSIDVIGNKPVVIDNFGSMPDEAVFTRAIEAMLSTREASLLRYCRERRIRYLILPHPAYIPATARTIGVRTPLARRTVWSRLYTGERIPGFALVSGGSIEIWQIE
jgi:hypothetical protein